MINYNLPKFKTPKLIKPKGIFFRIWKEKPIWAFTLVIVASSLFGFFAGSISSGYFYIRVADYLDRMDFGIDLSSIIGQPEYLARSSHEQAVIDVVEKASPAVVSIIVTKDLPIIEEYYYSPFEDPFFEDFKVPGYRQKGVEKREVGGGTGFIISEDGMILTNRHVVLDEEADYTVLTLDGKKFPAQALARDPIQDIAILKIEPQEIKDEQGKTTFQPFPKVKLGDSDKIQIGQTAIAIGYVLGRYQNAVSLGVISGLGRTITASGGGFYETLEDIIQTDAAINKGNSGGPLLNLKGEVIGINTAIDIEGQSIGFAIPSNKAKRDVEQVKATGKITYPFLGVRYVILNATIQGENNLPVDYGAWITKGREDYAIFPGSVAQEVGLEEGDIILEFDGERITVENSLAKIIMKYKPGDKVLLKVLSGTEEKNIEVVLGEKSE